MRTILSEAVSCFEHGEKFVLATVIHTWGSAPRKAGAHMLMTADKMFGSVSGGCVENDVVREAKILLQQGGSKLLHYGVSDQDAWQVGLSCGGKIDVLIEAFSPDNGQDQEYWNAIRSAIETDTAITVFHGIDSASALRRAIVPEPEAGDVYHSLARQAYERRAHQSAEIDGHAVFIEVVQPKLHLIIFGASHITAELVALAKQFHFKTTVIDPRGFFVDQSAYTSTPDRILDVWPAELEYDLNPYTFAVTLSHDPKIDDQALDILLKSDVAYIGALGGKKTHGKRIERLRAMGYGEHELERIHAPVGVNLNAQSAQEIALSILAELIAEKNKYK